MNISNKGFDIAIVGATGTVGETVRELLEKREFPVKNLHLLASERTAGTQLMFNSKPVSVKLLHEFDFHQVQIAIFVATDQVSADYAPQASQAGCIVLDNSQCYIDDHDVPLIIPGVNTTTLDAINPHRKIVANPDSVVIQLWTVLKPIYDIVPIARINVATYQAVSGQGKQAVTELAMQTASVLNGRGAEKKFYKKQITFNVLPAVGKHERQGYSSAEWQLVQQSKRIIADPQLQLNVTCVQVPVFYADSMVVNIETNEPIKAEEVVEVLKKNNEIKVIDDFENDGYATPVTDAASEDMVFVSRIRNDLSHDCGLNMWIVGDNVRKGAALNIVQIAESLIKSYL